MRDFARLALFFASPRRFDFLECETETSKYSECERESSDSKNSSPLSLKMRYTTAYKSSLQDAHNNPNRRDCETREIRRTFYETQSVCRSIHQP